MPVKRSFAGLAIACVVWFGTVSGAESLSFNEFDRLASHQKENFISTVLHFYYYNFAKNPETLAKANCMVDLDRAKGDGNDPRLLSLILHDLNDARTGSGRRSETVEGVISAVIERECATR